MNGVAKFLSRAAGKMVVAAALLPGWTALAANTADVLSADDQACLICHASEGRAAEHAQGDRKAPVIMVEAYARSMHRDLGCIGCHEAIQLPAHPGKNGPTKNVQGNAPRMTQVCRNCHGKVAKTYDPSFHAQRLRAGKSGADCVDCHTPHAVTAAWMQADPKNTCLSCHDNPAESHQTWLPNAARHMQAVACSACHAPQALLRVDLRLVVASGAAGAGIGAVFEQLARQADQNNDGLDANEFHALLQAFQRRGTPVSVSGRIEPRSGVQAHLLLDKSRALRDCFGCHDQDAPPYKSVTVSMIDANDAPVRYDAQREILTSAVTTQALKGFYVLGGTRLGLLDWLLAIGLGFGISVPALHFVARRKWGRTPSNKDRTS